MTVRGREPIRRCPGWHRFNATTIGAIAWCVAMPLAAQTGPELAPTEPVRVIDRASSCISAERFFALLAQHRTTIRQANATELATQFAIRVTIDATVTGELTIVGPDGTESNRTVVGQSCEEVADALALVGALSIDPLASKPQPSAPAAQTLAPSAIAPPRSVRLPRIARAAASRIWIDAATVQVVNAKPVAKPQARRRVLQQGVGAESFAQIGTSGLPWIGIAAKYWLSPGWDGIGRLPLNLMLGVSRTVLAEQSVSSHDVSATVKYRLTSLDAGICPFGVRPIDTMRLWACGIAEVGWLQAAEDRTGSSKGDAGPFFGLSLTSRLDVKIYGRLGFVAGLGAHAPITTYQIHVDSLAGSPVVQLRPISALGTIGLELSSW